MGDQSFAECVISREIRFGNSRGDWVLANDNVCNVIKSITSGFSSDVASFSLKLVIDITLWVMRALRGFGNKGISDGDQGVGTSFPNFAYSSQRQQALCTVDLVYNEAQN
jgi:hypothetical protein